MSLFLVMLVPLATAPLVYLLRSRSALAAPLASAVSLAMAGFIMRLPEDTIWVVGRGLALCPLNRFVLALAFATSAALFLAASLVPQGWSFPPFGLVILALLSAAALYKGLSVAILHFWMAGALAIPVIQGGRRGSTRGALRYLVMLTLAMPILLVAAWLLDLHLLEPENVALVKPSVLLLAMGFGILMAAVPFHSWVPTLAADAPPLVTAFVLGPLSSVAFLIFMSIFPHHTWLLSDPRMPRLLVLAGLLMAMIGALLSPFQRSLGRLLGYAALCDAGVILVGLGTFSGVGWTGVLFHLLHRATALFLASTGLAFIRHLAGGRDTVEGVRGVGWRALPAALAWLWGGLSLAGLPLTDGFVGRWVICRALAREDLALALTLLLAGGGVGMGFLRTWASLMGSSTRVKGRLSLLPGVVLLLALIVALWEGLYPSPFLPPLQEVVESLAFLRPF